MPPTAQRVNCTCGNPSCGKIFQVTKVKHDKGHGKYCSNACRIGNGPRYDIATVDRVKELCNTHTRKQVADIIGTKECDLNAMIYYYRQQGHVFGKPKRIYPIKEKKPKTVPNHKIVKMKPPKEIKKKERILRPVKLPKVEKPIVIKQFNPDTQMHLKVNDKTYIIINKCDYEQKSRMYAR